MSEYSVELKGLNKVYSNLLKEDTIALKDINLQIRPGEFISIIGPSGCGKSTLLRIIGNLDKPTSGTIEYRDGADQQMGFVFQDSVLLPWKNVRQHACDNVQQGGFSAAGRTQYADDLVFMDFHADSLKHFRLSKAFCQIFYF